MIYFNSFLNRNSGIGNNELFLLIKAFRKVKVLENRQVPDLTVFVISAPSSSYFSILSIPAFSVRTCSCSASTFSSSPQR